MPSGHSAISFALATIITVLTTDPLVMILAYVLAFIVAQSRVDSEVHSVWEVFIGGVLGTFLTLFLYLLMV